MAMRATILRLLLALGLMAAAPGLYMTAGFGAPDRSRPVLMELPLDGRWVESATFRAAPPGGYRASLLLDRRHPHREMECLADVGFPSPTSGTPGRHPDCPAAFRPLVVEWTLLENGLPAKPTYDFGLHAGEYSGDTVGRSFATFDLARGVPYRVRARVIDAADAVTITRLRLQLAYDDMARLLVRSLFWSVAAGVLVFAGLTLLARTLRRVEKPGAGDATT